MENHIINLRIRNFKSIRDVTLDCKRLNLFIGEPNVGKSNILEALSLFSADYLPERNLSLITRFKTVQDLFHIHEVDKPILIKIKSRLDIIQNFKIAHSSEKPENYSIVHTIYDGNLHEILAAAVELFTPDKFPALESSLEESGTFTEFEFNQVANGNDLESLLRYAENIKPYFFKEIANGSINKDEYQLEIPNGSNLFSVLLNKSEISQEVSKYFTPYDLKLMYEPKEKGYRITNFTDTTYNSYPYELAAETLRRMIFHIAAIETNKDSILIFEEPEAQCFPPHVWELAHKIYQSETNQFFIATHSPYVVNTLNEEADADELAIFIVYYEDHQTKVRALTAEERGQIIDYGVDLFFNYEKFKKPNV